MVGPGGTRETRKEKKVYRSQNLEGKPRTNAHKKKGNWRGFGGGVGKRKKSCLSATLRYQRLLKVRKRPDKKDKISLATGKS